MATTTNYSWTTPDDTALVKDGAAAIRTLGSAIDTTTKALNPSTTLGDIEYRSSTANTNTRLGIGTTGQVLTVSGGVPSWQTISTGTTFTQRLATGTRFNQIAYNGSNLYVAVGATGQLYSSTNGTTWTSRTSGFGTNRINDVAFGNGLFVAVGANGTITTSTDGTTWTARSSGFLGGAAINAVTYANSLWVAVGDAGGSTNNGGITYSTDGLTWTRKSQTLTVGPNYYCVVWNGTNWIVGAQTSTNNYLYASTPSGTWTVGATGSNQDILAMFWDGTRHTTNETLTWRYSTSTTLGTTTVNNFNGTPRNALNNGRVGSTNYYNGKIYLANTVGYQSFTPDSTAYPVNDPVQIAGTNYIGTTNRIDGDNSLIWVGAAGIILGDTQGRLYTSF